MKLLVATLGLSILFAACNNQTDEQAESTDNSKHLIEYLDKESLKEKVFNYEENEEWKYNGSQPCIIDFYADWCAPCRMLAPTLDEIAKEYDGKVLIYKVNTDKEKELSQAFGIQSLPTLVFIPMMGNPYVQKGLVSKQDLDKLINKVLLPKTELSIGD